MHTPAQRRGGALRPRPVQLPELRRLRHPALCLALEHGIVENARPLRRLRTELPGNDVQSLEAANEVILNHPHCLWAGIYYVASASPDAEPRENGRPDFLDPRARVNMVARKATIFEARYLIDPLPGLMVMFPAWSNHFVHPFDGEGERISIAFNVVTTEIPAPVQLACRRHPNRQARLSAQMSWQMHHTGYLGEAQEAAANDRKSVGDQRYPKEASKHHDGPDRLDESAEYP